MDIATNIFSLRKRVLATLFFIFLSSCTSNCSKWEYDQVIAPCAIYSSSRIVYPSQNISNGIEVEIVNSYDDLKMYLNVHACILRTLEHDPNKVALSVNFNNQTTEYTADVFSGGQRLLIPGDATQKIIDALLDNQTVHISMGYFNTDLCPEGFAEAYFCSEDKNLLHFIPSISFQL